MAQLGARLNGIQKVRGSSPLSSTKENQSKPVEVAHGFCSFGCARFFLRTALTPNTVGQQTQTNQHHENRTPFVGHHPHGEGYLAGQGQDPYHNNYAKGKA